MSRRLRRVFAGIVLLTALTAVPLPAAAADIENDGSYVISVRIEPMAECTEPCVVPPASEDLAPTGLDLVPALLLALGASATGAALFAVSRRRARLSSR